ncbi:20244_t:CDS:1, partial [Racocetra persica]
SLKYAKFSDIQSKIQSWQKSKKDIWDLVESLMQSDEYLPEKDNFELYKKFIQIIDMILFYCQKLKISYNNKIVLKYNQIREEILSSSDSNQFVIDLSIKYSKYKFKPHLYQEKPELLFPIIKLEKYFVHISRQVDSSQYYISKKELKKTINFEKLSKWIKQKFNKTYKTSLDFLLDEENLSIDSNFDSVICEKLENILDACLL